jgi:hypothetical protein
MSDAYVLLAPVLTFLVVALCGFVGCSSFASVDPWPGTPPEEEKPPETPPPETPPETPPVPKPPPTYEEVIEATPGIAALWLLNETTGNQALESIGAISPPVHGEYITDPAAPAGGGYDLAAEGVLFPKDPQDFAPEFNGTGSYIEVPFRGPLNPDPAAPGFSIELWVMPAPTEGADRHVLVSSHHHESDAKQQGYEIGLLKVAAQAHQKVYARVYSGTGATFTEVSVQPLDGAADEWRHIVFTYEGGAAPSIRLRVQLLKATGAYAANPVAASYENVTLAKQSTLRFASNHPAVAGLALFAGRLDNIAFYNAPLSDGDIQAHFEMA